MRRLPFLLLFLVLPLSAETLRFKVLGIDCDKCGPPIVKALSSVAGVKNVHVDTKTGLTTVDVPAGFETARIHAAIADAGFESELPGETHAEFAPLPPEVLKTLDINAIDGKTKIDVKNLLAPNKVTVVDFYADWCGPCRILEARLQRYVQAHPNVAVRRVNIGHWDNYAATQATHEFHAEALPYLRVYDARGKFVTAVTGGMWDEVLGALERADKTK
jgi:thiol-disulfide isomerase/thioredoxin